MRNLNFAIQASLLSALAVINMFSVTHWKGPLIIGCIVLVPSLLVQLSGWYKDNLFWYLHLSFGIAMIGTTGFLAVSNHQAYAIGMKRHQELQVQVCEGRAFDMKGWSQYDSNKYEIKYMVLGQPYRILAIIGEDKKTFETVIRRGYDILGGGYVAGGPSACGSPTTAQTLTRQNPAAQVRTDTVKNTVRRGI